MKLYGSLDNYILMHRKRAGLSQDELAVLVGVENRGSVARYELGLRLPELETLIRLEIALGAPASELFAGIAERLQSEVSERARILLESLGDAPTKENMLKLETFSRLAYPDEVRIIPSWEDTP